MVELVLTERRSDLTRQRSENYARLHERLAAASGQPVETSFYEEVDPDRLARSTSIVLSGSSAPWAAHDPAALDRLGAALIESRRPVLGICAGMQLLARFSGGTVAASPAPERGFLPVRVLDASDLLEGLPGEVRVFQDHEDEVAVLPPGFRVLAESDACAVQAIADPARRWWGTQFHPEEATSEHPAGERVLRTFFSLAG